MYFSKIKFYHFCKKFCSKEIGFIACRVSNNLLRITVVMIKNFLSMYYVHTSLESGNYPKRSENGHFIGVFSLQVYVLLEYFNGALYVNYGLQLCEKFTYPNTFVATWEQRDLHNRGSTLVVRLHSHTLVKTIFLYSHVFLNFWNKHFTLLHIPLDKAW